MFWYSRLLGSESSLRATVRGDRMVAYRRMEKKTKLPIICHDTAHVRVRFIDR